MSFKSMNFLSMLQYCESPFVLIVVTPLSQVGKGKVECSQTCLTKPDIKPGACSTVVVSFSVRFLLCNYIHVTESLFHNWRFAIFQLEIWSQNWRFFIDMISKRVPQNFCLNSPPPIKYLFQICINLV